MRCRIARHSLIVKLALQVVLCVCSLFLRMRQRCKARRREQRCYSITNKRQVEEQAQRGHLLTILVQLSTANSQLSTDLCFQSSAGLLAQNLQLLLRTAVGLKEQCSAQDHLSSME